MPHKGFKSVTLKEGTYDYFEDMFADHFDEMEMEGVNNFSAFITKLLYMGERAFSKEMERIRNDD